MAERNEASPRTQLCERGQGLAEYLVIVIIVSVLVILAIRQFGGSIGDGVEQAKREIASAGSEESEKKVENKESAQTQRSSEGGETNPQDGGTSSDMSDEDTDGAADAEVIPSEGGEEDIGRVADSLSRGVGITEPRIPTTFVLSPVSLLLIGLGICAIGFFLVSRLGKKDRSKIKKKKRKKKGLFRFIPSLRVPSGDGSSDESGQALVEFLFSIITFLFLVLGVIQLALILNAYTLVRYAAYNAARAGIVHSADLDKMREAARISLVSIFPRHGRADHVRGITENYLGARFTDQNNLDDFDKPITEVSILSNNSAVGGSGFSGSIMTFDDPAQAENAVITVQVIHHYEMVVPLVNRILYFLYFKFTDDAYEGEDIDQLAAKTDRLRRDGELEDIEFRFPLTAHYTMRMQSDYDPSQR